MELTETEQNYYIGQAEGLLNELKSEHKSREYIREKLEKLWGLLK